MTTPAKIQEAARCLVEMFGDHVEHLGKYQGAEAYYYHFPDDIEVGFPIVYLLKNEEVTEVSGFDALQLLGRFLKD